MRTPGLRILKGILYLVYLLTASLAIVYVFAYRPYVDELASNFRARDDWDRNRFVSAQTLRRLGSLNNRDRASFADSHPTKKPGTLRLCTLGDSHTAGSELAASLEYPAYLQREFGPLGVDNVEVLNFGNSWYGFSQIGIMWEEVASRFECDAILLLAFDFWWSRDTTFNHAGEQNPRYLHARYVLSGDGVRLVDVSGATNDKRFARYHAFIPRWRYLRYDRNPPALVRSVLPKGKIVPNPLYYADDPRTEAWEMNRRVLDRMAGDGVPIVVMFRRLNEYSDILMKRARENIAFGLVRNESGRFPYSTPIWHRTAFSAQRMAREFLRTILAEPPESLPVMKFSNTQAITEWEIPPPLNQADAITLQLPAGEAGVLVSVHDRRMRNESRHRATMAATAYRGLLAIATPDGSLFDACLLPLDQPIATQEEVTIVRDDGSRTTLGRPVLAAPGVAIWVLEMAGSQCSGVDTLRIPTDLPGDGETAYLVAGENRIPGRATDDSLIFGESHQAMYKFTGLGHFPADVRELAETGTLTIVFEKGETVRRIPLARWRLENAGGVKVLTPPRFEIRIDDGRARIAPRQPGSNTRKEHNRTGRGGENDAAARKAGNANGSAR